MKKNKNIEDPDKAFFISDITKGLKAKQEEYNNNKASKDTVNVENKILNLKSLIKRHKPK